MVKLLWTLHANYFSNLTHLCTQTGDICFRIWLTSSSKLGKFVFESDPTLHTNWGNLFPSLTHLCTQTGEICFRVWLTYARKLGKFVSESDSPLHANWVIKRSTFHNPQCEMAGIFATESPTAFRNITGLVFWRMDFCKTLKCNLFFLETRCDASQWWGGGRWLQ